MDSKNKTIVTVETEVNAAIEKCWESWTNPKHIVNWNFASDDWHTTSATNDLRVGGNFISRMEAKDKSFGFDFGGTYDEIKLYEFISYKIGDGRQVEIKFEKNDNKTKIIESFEIEEINSAELQKNGWQAILNNFKKYTEKL